MYAHRWKAKMNLKKTCHLHITGSFFNCQHGYFITYPSALTQILYGSSSKNLFWIIRTSLTWKVWQYVCQDKLFVYVYIYIYVCSLVKKFWKHPRSSPTEWRGSITPLSKLCQNCWLTLIATLYLSKHISCHFQKAQYDIEISAPTL